MNAQLVIGRDHLVGVEAHQQPDNTWLFHWVHLQQRKDGVRVLRQGSGLTAAGDLAREIGTRYPIALVVLGDRVLLRSVEGGFKAERDLQKLLPNVRPDELVIDIVETGHHSQLGIVRRQVVDMLLDDLGSAELRIVALHIGPWVLFSLREHWTVAGHATSIGDHAFKEQDDGSWNHTLDPSRSSRTVVIGDEEVDALCICALSACWQQWYQPVPMKATSVGAVTRAVNEERYRLRYERGLLALIALLLILFAGDVLLRQHLDSGQMVLQEALDQQARSNVLIDSLDRSLRTREDLVRMTGIGNAGGTMRSLDHLAASVPPEVTLNELWLAPPGAPVREGEPFKRSPGLVSITGEVMDPAVLPAWLGRMKAMADVRNARLVSLGQDQSNGTPVFHIEVQLP